MAGGDLRLQRELELAEAPVLPPVAEEIPNRTSLDPHGGNIAD